VHFASTDGRSVVSSVFLVICKQESRHFGRANTEYDHGAVYFPTHLILEMLCQARLHRTNPDVEADFHARWCARGA